MGRRYQTSIMELKTILIVLVAILLLAFVSAAYNIYVDTDFNEHVITGISNIGSTSDEVKNIYIETNSKIYFGNGQEANIYYNGTNLIISG